MRYYLLDMSSGEAHEVDECAARSLREAICVLISRNPTLYRYGAWRVEPETTPCYPHLREAIA